MHDLVIRGGTVVDGSGGATDPAMDKSGNEAVRQHTQ